MVHNLTPEQRAAIKQFWAKAKPKGWKYSEEARGEENGTVVITMLDPRGHKHWLRVTAEGSTAFSPVIMTCF